MRDTILFAALRVGCSRVCAAQEPGWRAKEATGGVTGHVLCADTNLPARLASVLLQPAYEAMLVKPKRKPGEEASDNDEPRPPMVSIAQTSMHAISGSIIDASGHTVNAGRVSIFYPDDDSELVSTAVSKEDDEFHFYFVPEGTYTLKVAAAKDVTRTEVPYPPGNPFMPPTHTEEKIMRQYQDEKQPLVVEGDMMGVVATVATKDLKTTAQ